MPTFVGLIYLIFFSLEVHVLATVKNRKLWGPCDIQQLASMDCKQQSSFMLFSFM
jgi:hypothetical protein